MRAKTTAFKFGSALCLLTVIALISTRTGAYSDAAPAYTDRKYGLQKTLFVVDIVANGAFSSNNEEVFGAGVVKGKLTDVGRLEAARLGLRRKQEYIAEKRLLPVKFNHSAVLALSPLSKKSL